MTAPFGDLVGHLRFAADFAPDVRLGAAGAVELSLGSRVLRKDAQNERQNSAAGGEREPSRKSTVR